MLAKYYNLESFLVAAVLIVLSVLLLNPFDFFMPDRMVMVIVVAMALVFVLFAGLVWQEKPGDEREVVHRMATDRVAYLVGIGSLLIVVAVQGFAHQVESWAVLSLAAMVLAKALARIYFQIRN